MFAESFEAMFDQLGPGLGAAEEAGFALVGLAQAESVDPDGI